MRNVLVFIILFLNYCLSLAQTFDETDPLILQAQITPAVLHPGQGFQITIETRLPKEFHAYSDQFKLISTDPYGFNLGQIKIRNETTWYDQFSKKNRSGIGEKATLEIQGEAPLKLDTYKGNIDHHQLNFELTYQACSSKFCLFPMTRQFNITVQLKDFVIDNSANDLAKNSVKIFKEQSWTDFFSVKNFEGFLSHSLFSALIFVFLAGIFTSFTPCIFPMIPITLAILAKESQKQSRIHNFLVSVVYVLGIATTYSILGIIAASSGGIFGSSLGSPIVLSIMCIIFLAMSLSMYGAFEIQVPNFLRQKFGTSHGMTGYPGVYLSGLFAGIVASPCVGPVLVGILSYVSTQKSIFIGFILLFTYALGLGLIFIALGLSNQLTRFLPKSGPWMNFFKFILGSLMLSGFYYYLHLLVSNVVFDLLLGLGFITVGSYFGAFQTPKEIGGKGFSRHKVLFHLRRGHMLALVLAGGVFIWNGVTSYMQRSNQLIEVGRKQNPVINMNWVTYSEESLEQAKRQKQAVIIDFYADWCAACHELAEKTFSHDSVQKLGKNFVLLKFDATSESIELKKLKKQYSIMGLPTVVFISRQGEWLKDETLTSFEEPELFEKRMSRVLQK